MDGRIYWMTLPFLEVPSELMLAFPHCCAQLAGLSGGEIFYLGSSIIIKSYSALSPTIGEQDGMDGGGAYWMTLPFLEAFRMQQFLMDLVDYWYSWNNYVIFHLIATKITPLDLH
jgi:hypothetical protein